MYIHSAHSCGVRGSFSSKFGHFHRETARLFGEFASENIGRERLRSAGSGRCPWPLSGSVHRPPVAANLSRPCDTKLHSITAKNISSTDKFASIEAWIGKSMPVSNHPSEPRTREGICSHLRMYVFTH